MSDTHDVNAPISVNASLSSHIVHSTNTSCYLPVPVLEGIILKKHLTMSNVASLQSVSEAQKFTRNATLLLKA